jgi:anti-sigma-K factor RskA
MNIRDLEQQDFDGDRPPSADVFAGEYVLGVLDADQRREAETRIAQDPGFARLVGEWEAYLAPLAMDATAVEPPAHLWPRIRTTLGWSPVGGEDAKPGVWQSASFWRGAALLATAAAVAAIAIGPLGIFKRTVTPPSSDPIAVEPTPPIPTPIPPVEDPDAPKPVSTLVRDDGSTGWLASVDTREGTVLMVPVPGKPDTQGREPELWLIAPGESPKSLGIVSIDRSHTVKVPDTLREGLAKGAVLAITLEPRGGAPQGIATGPIIAKGDIVLL